MHILVTGGAGFIGSHTVDALLAKGHRVRILDNLQPRVHPRGLPPWVSREAEFAMGDVRNRADWEKALEGIEAVFHLAAYQDYMRDFSTFFHVNAVSPALLIELIVERGYPVRKIVFASSQAAYGEGRFRCAEHGVFIPLPRPLSQLEEGRWEIACPVCGREAEWQLTDETAVSPHTSYAISKYASELAFINLGRRYGIPTVGMRYSITHGPRNSFYNAYSGICRIFSQRFLAGERPIVFEDGLQLRDYINVEDVVRANLLAMEDPRADWEVFNAGAGRGVTVLEFARVMAGAFGKPDEPLLTGEFRVGDTRHTVSDIAKLKKLGWAPLVSIEETAARYVAWLKEQADARQGFYVAADREMRARNVIMKARAR
ncbi:MAG: NAD-dependent epimerase/dehydratase family protein [Chlamydiota bacterium]